MARKKRSDDLTAQMDIMAATLLKEAKNDGTSLVNRLDTFEIVAKWLQIKFRIEGDDSGAAIAGYKDRIRAAQEGGAADKRSPGNDRRPTIPSRDADRGGPALEALKRRIPQANSGGALGSGGHPGGAVAVIDGLVGGVLAGPAGGDGPGES